MILCSVVEQWAEPEKEDVAWRAQEWHQLEWVKEKGKIMDMVYTEALSIIRTQL